MLIDQPIPNLFGGVSQQPPQARFLNQLEIEDNCLADPVEGLRKRPPLEFLKLLDSLGTADAAIIPIERDALNRFVAIVQNGRVRVFDLDGNEKTVSNNSPAYLSTATPSTSIKALTVADYTFLVNSEVTVTASSDVITATENVGFVWVRAGNYGRTYKIVCKDRATNNPLFTRTYTTPNGDNANQATQVDTAYIASFLGSTVAGFTVTVEGSLIRYTRDTADDFYFEVEDGQGGEAMKGYKGKVQRFSDLPEKGVEGLVLEVAGDNSSAFDNYFVKYEEGVWSETVKPGIQYRMNSDSLPLGLVRNPDDTFVVQALPWVDRAVGDDDSNPFPSFVGQKLNGVLYFRNRLGFIADENLILSATGDYFQFFRTTVTQLLDNDVIDVAVQDVSGAGSSVSVLRHAVAFDKRLLLFSDNAQFVVDSGGQVLSPLTIAVDPVTSFAASAACRPGVAGRYVYFPFDRDGASGIREMYVDGVTQTEDAEEITAHCPTYIPPGLTQIIGTTLENIMLFIKSGSRYVYKYEYFWSGQEKAQSGFGRWDFGSDAQVLGGSFFDNTAYFVIKRGSEVTLERMRLRPGLVDTNLEYFTLLDRRLPKEDMMVAYDGVANKTYFTFPYSSADELEIRTVASPSDQHAPGVKLGTKTAANVVTVDGDVSTYTVIGGVKYAMSFKVTAPYLTQTTSGSNRVANTRAIVKVRDYQLDYVGSGYFDVTFAPQYRETYTKIFAGDIVSSTPTDIPNLQDGQFGIKTPCRNKYFNLTISNDSPFPSRFLAASWRGLVESKSRRV
ncbi:MAG: hypothetical protein MK081_13295 [Flavobacteriales bacterium]|nr:hypothetical protein [Flavobacteriales bacterium]